MKCYFKQTTKISGEVVLLAVFLILVLLSSCLDPYYLDSKSNIVKRSTDTALNDSALIYGTVVVINSDMPYPNADVWIEGTEIKTTSDIYGKFSLKILPGTYSIKCLHPLKEERFMMTLKDISVSPNEKVEILFSHGIQVE